MMVNDALIKLEDLLQRPLMTSSDGDAHIYGIVREGRITQINGYINSESREGYLHKVKAVYEPGSRHLLYGDCTCEAFKYYGDPCKHIIKLKNVYIKNADRLST